MSNPYGTPGNPFDGDDDGTGRENSDRTGGGSSLPSYNDYAATDGAGGSMDDYATSGPTLGDPGTGQVYPGAGKRFGAFLIDYILLGIVGVILVAIFAGSAISDYMDEYQDWQDAGSVGDAPTMSAGGILVASLLTLVVWFAYRVFCETRNGQTLGKKLLHITVTQEDGSPVSARTSFQRNSWYIVVFLLTTFVGNIGILVSLILYIVLGVMIARNPFGQHTFDQWAKSYVVNAR